MGIHKHTYSLYTCVDAEVYCCAGPYIGVLQKLSEPGLGVMSHLPSESGETARGSG